MKERDNLRAQKGSRSAQDRGERKRALAPARYDDPPGRKQMMAKRLRGPIGVMSGNQLAAAVRDSAQQIWLAGLGAFSTTRKEGNKVFEALVNEGEAIQSVTKKAARAGLSEAAAKAAGSRRRFERLCEDSVARSFRRFGVPTRGDLDNLSKRLAALAALIDRLKAEVSRRRTAAKRAAPGSR